MPSKKIAAYTKTPPAVVAVRAYDEATDKAAVEELERLCELGQHGKPSIVTDLMGDPLARVRNFACHIMLVAEYGGGEIVGIVRGCIKTVGRRKKEGYVKLGYVLGLRVSSTHRRQGIATKLVREIEAWCSRNGAEYAYMATDCNNTPCLNLFTKKLNYVEFLNPTVLVQPVRHKRISLPPDIQIIRLPPRVAATVYRHLLVGNSEFFPQDIDRILDNKLNLGTFMAVPRDTTRDPKTILDLPACFAVLSIWNTKEVFRLQVKGASAATRLAWLGARAADAVAPWLGIPSVPDIFGKFGFYFVYGMHMEGEGCRRVMTALCRFAHNMAAGDEGCRAVVGEVGEMEAVRGAVPHWKKYSCSDLWCMKRLGEDSAGLRGDYWRCDPTKGVFVDPRDI